MVAIKNMEMPKNCIECNFRYCENPWFKLCLTTGRNVIECTKERHPNCPLIEIEQSEEYQELVEKLQKANSTNSKLIKHIERLKTSDDCVQTLKGESNNDIWFDN